MSTFNTIITIDNKLGSELFNPTYQILNGDLYGKLPETINTETITSPIQINASNRTFPLCSQQAQLTHSTSADDGSSGSITYDVVINTITRQLTINFVCNNALRNSVTVGSPTPGIFNAVTSSYSQADHPLKGVFS